MESIFLVTRQEKIAKRVEERIKGSGQISNTGSNQINEESKNDGKPDKKKDDSKDGESTKQTSSHNDLKNKLFYFPLSALSLEEELRQASGSTLVENCDAGSEGSRQRSTIKGTVEDEEGWGKVEGRWIGAPR